jgi:two-component system, NarL family, invasion response regulator UvrY
MREVMNIDFSNLKKKSKIQVAIVDDHNLMRVALVNFVSSFKEFHVVFDAGNGKDFIEKIAVNSLPDIVLLDINMPLMNGFETMNWLKKHYPQVKVLALTMNSDEGSIIKMLRLGAKGYITKNAEPEELKLAIHSIYEKSFYLSAAISGKVIAGLNNGMNEEELSRDIFLTQKEREFLYLVCSELSYREIAQEMNMSQRTLEDYRTALFEKLDVRTRVGIVLSAIKNDLIEL